MTIQTLFNEEIWICSTDEAKRIWQEKPKDRHRIWTESEAKITLLLGPKELREIVKRKMSPKGFVYKGAL